MDSEDGANRDRCRLRKLGMTLDGGHRPRGHSGGSRLATVPRVQAVDGPRHREALEMRQQRAPC